MGVGALCNLEHRGATGAEADTGDGAGILIQVPHRFLRRGRRRSTVPPDGAYAVGLAFLPADPVDAEKAPGGDRADRRRRGPAGARLARRAGRPRVPRARRARAVMPSFRHLFLSDPAGATGIDLDRKVFVARKRIEHELDRRAGDLLPVAARRAP